VAKKVGFVGLLVTGEADGISEVGETVGPEVSGPAVDGLAEEGLTLGIDVTPAIVGATVTGERLGTDEEGAAVTETGTIVEGDAKGATVPGTALFGVELGCPALTGADEGELLTPVKVGFAVMGDMVTGDGLEGEGLGIDVPMLGFVVGVLLGLYVKPDFVGATVVGSTVLSAVGSLVGPAVGTSELGVALVGANEDELELGEKEGEKIGLTEGEEDGDAKGLPVGI
jgi:hypothetical protein